MELWLNLVLPGLYVDHFLDVQAFDKVISDNVGCANHHVIHILNSQSKQKSLLDALEGIFGAAIVTNHFIVPKTHIEVLSLFLGCLQSLDHAWVHQIATQLDVDYFFTWTGLSTVGELRNTSGCLQKCLLRRRYFDDWRFILTFLFLLM